MSRNLNIEKSVDLILDGLEHLIAGGALGAPASQALQNIMNTHIDVKGNSVKLACIFFAAYSVVDADWDFNSIPVGIRGKYGDKRLAGGLSDLFVTYHNNITAFGENLGWKGNVRLFNLSTDPRFSGYIAALKALSAPDREIFLHHCLWVLFTSRVVPQALPPLPAAYLSYARCLDLCEKILKIPSEGHIQQFLVAAFLEVHRRRYGHEIVTHHPHAADKFDDTTGDIEEFRDGHLVAAYEVTVRDDWKNRLADFGKKAQKGGLRKYVIFASNVRSDANLRPALSLMDFVAGLHYDLAVVDVSEFFSVFCAELRRDELSLAFNRTYEFLVDKKLCGRADFQKAYKDITNEWLQA